MMNRKLLLPAAVVLGLGLGLAASGHAAIIPVLQSVTPGGGSSTFSYSAELSGDQGLKNGARLVIFDFAGYVPGSIFSPPSFTPSVEMSTIGLLEPLGFVDNPTMANLVFTWNAGDFDTSGGPFADVNYTGLGAKSTLGDQGIGVFAARAFINNGKAIGQQAFNTGQVGVPSVPEPAAWLLMFAGFGLVGGALRRRAPRPVTA